VKRVNCSREYRPSALGNTFVECERTRALKPVATVLSDPNISSDMRGEEVPWCWPCVNANEYDTDVGGFAFYKIAKLRTRGKLCRANPMSASGMKYDHRVV
jgi:hypothetical protein